MFFFENSLKYPFTIDNVAYIPLLSYWKPERDFVA